MSGERFSLDTNILVYAADRLAADRHRLAVELVNRAAGGDCILTLQSLAEFYHAVTRKGVVPAREAAGQVRDWTSLFPIAAADEASLAAALQLSSVKKVSIWDALILSTAAAAGCTVVVSEDMQDGQRLGGVRLCNPFKAGSLSEDVLRLLDGQSD